MLPDEAQLLIGAIKRNGVEILTYPGGWPENVELALIDTVLSIRARYGTSPETGVRGAIKRYRAETGRPSWNDLGVLAETDSAWLQGVLANQQKTGGVPKAEAIVSAAGRLVRAGA